MTSDVGDNHLPESLSGPCGCFRYHELNTLKVTKGCCMRAAWARVESETLQGFEDNSVLSRTHLRNRAARHDSAAHRSVTRSRPAAMLLGEGLCCARYNGAEHGSVTIPVFR
jgi:hypothetical protein